MTKNLSSQHMQAKISPEHLKWAQSVDKTLSAGVDMGVPIGQDPTGVYNAFEQGNSNGTLIRIGATASTEAIKWSGIGVGIVIQHGLDRQPIGFKIVDKDKSVDVFRTAVPTDTTITLAPTDNTASVTVYVF